MDKLKRWRDMSTKKLMELRDMADSSICSLCEKLTDTNAMYTVHGSKVCIDCRMNIKRCATCAQPALVEIDGICKDCLRSKRIRSYGYKPYPKFHRVDRSGGIITSDEPRNYLHFGVETEADSHESNGRPTTVHSENLASIVHMVGTSVPKTQLFYVKNDSSLSGDGAEIVSHPFSWKFFKDYGYDIYETLFSVLKKADYCAQETSTAGMHIHLSKSAISRLMLFKILFFVYHESDFMGAIAQRDPEDLEEWASTSIRSLLGMQFEDTSQPNYAKKVRQAMYQVARLKRGLGGQRSTAVNLENAATAEFRIFKGTLNIMTFAKNMEFLHSLVMYSKVAGIKSVVSDDRVNNYITHLNDNQRRYPNLCFFLARYHGFNDSFKREYKRWTRRYMVDLGKIDYYSDKKGV